MPIKQKFRVGRQVVRLSPYRLGCATRRWVLILVARSGSPLHFAVLIGMKPTYGRISRHGIIAYASSFDQVGTITRSVEDAALLLEVMAGPDEYDSTLAVMPAPAINKDFQKPSPKKIAYLQEAISSPGVDGEVKNNLVEYI